MDAERRDNLDESMRRAVAKPRVKRIAFEAFCTLLSFLLVFNLSFSLQYAFAEGEGGSETETPEPEPEPSHYIRDLQVFYEKGESQEELGSASDGYASTVWLTRKGENGRLIAVAWWEDGSSDRNPTGATFKSSDDSVVTVNASGEILAMGDGSATITVSLTKNTSSGDPISLKVPVEVSGQSGKSISSLSIYCAEYPDSSSITIDDTNKEDVYLHFYARVVLEDGSVYDTVNGRLSQQDSDLEDLLWFVSDSQVATIDQIYGEYRQREFGVSNVFAMSSTYDSESQQINVDVKNTDSNPESHPQDTLTVSITWAQTTEDGVEDPPDKVYTRSDLAALGTTYARYTLSSGSSVIWAEGYGVPLRALLADACEINPSEVEGAISKIRFQSGADGGNYEVYANVLFAARTNFRDDGTRLDSSAEPMLAFDSNWMSFRAAESGKEKPLTNATQFRLLMGSRSFDERVTGNSIKWINHVSVVLSATPPSPSDDPNDVPNPSPDNPVLPSTIPFGGTGGSGEGGSGGRGTGSGVGLAGTGTGVGSGFGSGVQSGTSGSGEGAYSIYQIVSPFSTALDVEYAQNPFKPFVLPLCLAAVAAGLTQAALWYRRQRMPFVCGGTAPMAGGVA